MTSAAERQARQEAEDAQRGPLIALAKEHYEDSTDHIAIDDNATFSEGADGIFVQAWVFLSNDALAEAGIANPEASYDNPVTCDGCGDEWDMDHLRPIEKLSMRVAPGEPMPAGECPACGALCHLSDEED